MVLNWLVIYIFGVTPYLVKLFMLVAQNSKLFARIILYWLIKKKCLALTSVPPSPSGCKYSKDCKDPTQNIQNFPLTLSLFCLNASSSMETQFQFPWSYTLSSVLLVKDAELLCLRAKSIILSAHCSDYWTPLVFWYFVEKVWVPLSGLEFPVFFNI